MRSLIASQYDFGDLIPLSSATPLPSGQTSVRDFVGKGLALSFPHFDRVYSPLVIANMMFTTVRMAVALKRASDEAGIPAPLVFLDKHLSDQQIQFIIDEVIRTHGNTNIGLVTGVKELKSDHPRNFLRMFAYIESEAQKTLGDNFRLQVPVCLDVPNAYIPSVADHIRQLSQALPHLPIIAGNVATGDIVPELIDAGAYGIKVGIGPGAMCTTRLVTGIGVPQLTAIHNARQGLGNRNGIIIGDGGIRGPIHAVEGLAAGGHAVMFASMFAGTNETQEYGSVPAYVSKDGQPWQPTHGDKYFIVGGSASSIARQREGAGPVLYHPREGEGRVGVAKCIGPIGPRFVALSLRMLGLVDSHVSALRAAHAPRFVPANTSLASTPAHIDDVMLWPKAPVDPQGSPVQSRGQVDLSTSLTSRNGSTTHHTSPIILRPAADSSYANVNDVIAALKAASQFATDVNGHLDLGDAIERPVAVIIPASLAARDLSRVIATLDAMPQDYKPHVIVEFTDAMIHICQDSARGALLKRTHSALLKTSDKNAIDTVRAAMDGKGFIAVEVNSLENLARAKLSDADGFALTADVQADNLHLLAGQTHDWPVIYRGLPANAASGDIAKIIALGADAVEIPVRSGTSQQVIQGILQDHTGGLRSSATFVGYHTGASVVAGLKGAPAGSVTRLVDHLHL